jgi:hypothetical protein
MYTHYRYAAERNEKLESANQLTPKSRYANWKPVTPMEMEGFLAIIVNMGLIQLPDIESYWNTSWVGHIPSLGACSHGTDLNKYFGCYMSVEMIPTTQTEGSIK